MKDKNFKCRDCKKEFREKAFTPEVVALRLCPQCYTKKMNLPKKPEKKDRDNREEKMITGACDKPNTTNNKSNIIINKPEKKQEWILYKGKYKEKPTIKELEEILDGKDIDNKDYELMPNGKLKIKDNEAIIFNQACDQWQTYHNAVLEKLADEGEIEKIIKTCPSIKWLIGYFEQIHETSTQKLIEEVVKIISKRIKETL